MNGDDILEVMDAIGEIVEEKLKEFRDFCIGVALILTFPLWIVPVLIQRYNRKHNKNYNKTDE